MREQFDDNDKPGENAAYPAFICGVKAFLIGMHIPEVISYVPGAADNNGILNQDNSKTNIPLLESRLYNKLYYFGRMTRQYHPCAPPSCVKNVLSIAHSKTHEGFQRCYK